ncbi:ABC transporter substrate-binding protein [bacterium]|nr:ABC transporter substrate-binding protein [bacterium]
MALKHIFALSFVALIGLSLVTYASLPHATSKIPVLYWVTDANPARAQQMSTFEQWMKREGNGDIDMRLDSTNNDNSKKIIQGVSGMAGDILDMYGGDSLRYIQSMGILEDVTEQAEELGFGPQSTWESIRPEITIDGRQYAYPCNVSPDLYWVNEKTFADAGLETPPIRMRIEEFERLGKQFVEAANPPGEHQQFFFADRVDRNILRRSLGLSLYNETLTQCRLDDPRAVRVLELVHKWTYDDRIIPSAADVASFSTANTYGGSSFQLFNNGNFALLFSGRWALTQFREFGALQLDVAEPPYFEFPNTNVNSRSSTVYAGTQNPEVAVHFLAFLASEDYNMLIVDVADALPPNPKYTETERFLHPADYPNEWGTHEQFARAAKELSVAAVYSPYVSASFVNRMEREYYEGYMAGLYDASEACRRAAERVNREIERNLEESPELQARYDQAMRRQDNIDARLAEGKPVPAEWIDNHFSRRYLAAKGLLE